MVNDARVGVNYVFINNGAAGNGLEFSTDVGLPGRYLSTILPAMDFVGGTAATIGNADVYQFFADTVIQYEDTLTWSKGRQTLQFWFPRMAPAYRYLLFGQQRLCGQHSPSMANTPPAPAR